MANGVKALGPQKVMAKNLLYAAAVKIMPYYSYLNLLRNAVIEKTAAPEMVDANPDGIYASIELIDNQLKEMYDAGTLYDLDPATIPNYWDGNTETLNNVEVQLVRMMPNSVANLYDFKLQDYVERMQNIYRQKDGLPMSSDNHVDQAKVQAFMERYDSCEQAKLDLGFATWEELVASANKDRLEYFEGQSSNTCATVKLEIEQKLVMTRQAFRGTLTIDNATGNDLTQIDLNVVVENLLGEQATRREFEIQFESITGFEGELNGPWTLGPNAKGVATILFIPTKYAAPETLTTYAFGGNLSWYDGSSYQTRGLYPVSLEVKPSPELDLTYFMQQDIYGDNPLTKDVVEPIIPAEFSVLIHNKGKGDATNVRMLTKQPKIVENEKGLMVDFAIVSSSLNGGEKAMALDSLIATQFGDIPAGTSAYATWDLTSTLLGHFIDYDVSVTHLTSYGNPDLSLLDQVTIHELIHSVNARFGEQQYRAWVCNDFEDGHSEPDHIYFSNGTDEAMVTLSNITSVTALGDSRWRVQVTVPQKEWFYTAVADPTGGGAKILSITDETTGVELDSENFWTTEYTMQDGFDPLPENKLHIVDYADGPKTFSYIVQFEPVPDLRLDVVSIETLPDDENGELAEAPINQLTVTFNKPIDPTTFTRDDIVLRYESVKQTTDLPIAVVSDPNVEENTAFTLNTSGLTADGYYILQVNTQNIRDTEGFLGKNGLQVKWMLFQDGLVHYNIGPWPSEEAGTVTVKSVSGNSATQTVTVGKLSYGTTIILTATPKTGYKFRYWATTKNAVGNSSAIRGRDRRRAPSTIQASDLEQFSTEAEINVEMNQTRDLVAVFEPEQYLVTMDCDAEAGSVNFNSGIYDYGTVVNLEAAANDGYQLLGFVINGANVDAPTGQYTYTVSGNDDIAVRFKDLSPVSVILQDTKDYTPVEVELANVKLQRSFRKGTWNTICLPCDVYNVEEVFGAGTELARLVGVENNVMQFNLVNVMDANIPYLIKPGYLNSSSLADGQTKTSFFDILGTSVETPDASGPIDDTNAGVQFIGSYAATQIAGGVGNYYISSDQLYYVDAAANVPSGRFRGYFHADGQNFVKRMGISFGGGTPTSFIDVPVPMTSDVYSLDGVLVRKTSEGTTRGLKPGIYIMGGQKVRVR